MLKCLVCGRELQEGHDVYYEDFDGAICEACDEKMEAEDLKAMGIKSYLYKGRVLSVQQTLSDLLFGIISSDPLQVGFGSDSYRWVKNRDLGRYKNREEAQAALDAFAAKHRLPRRK